MKQDNRFKFALALIIIISLTLTNVLAGVPTNPTIIYNTTETVDPKPQAYLNTSGGSFTTIILNASAQDYKWKAYVGNATGSLGLKDQDNWSIYDWALSTISGNVFVSRNDSVDWTNLSCSNRSLIESEDTALGINSSKVDSINKTFNSSVHKSFYAASKQIGASTCPAISTYIGGAAQSSGESNLFQEILLVDTLGNLIYTTILEDAQAGFDNELYDFQMIVADDETTQSSVGYYFYLELI